MNTLRIDLTFIILLILAVVIVVARFCVLSQLI